MLVFNINEIVLRHICVHKFLWKTLFLYVTNVSAIIKLMIVKYDIMLRMDKTISNVCGVF